MAVGVPNVRRRSTEMKKDLQQICADFNSLTLTMYMDGIVSIMKNH